MENRCQRCNRVLSDPNAAFGWRCAEILGVSEKIQAMGNGVFKKFLEGVLKAKNIFAHGKISLSDEQWKKLYSAFASMALWRGIDEGKVKRSRLEGYTVINNPPGKVKEFSESLREYADYIKQNGIITGTSKKLAKDGRLDDVTNVVLKYYDKKESVFAKGTGFGLAETAAHFTLATENYFLNQKVDLSGYKNGYINDQNSGAVSNLRLGFDKMKDNGCEVIAAYNSLKTLGNAKDIRDIAFHFENDGQMLMGKFGTNPYAVGRYFKNSGYKVKPVKGEDIVNKPIPKADTYILSFWNSDDVTDALHTVSVRPTRNGKYEVFNGDSNELGSEPADSFRGYIKDKKLQPLTLFCILE